MEQHGDAGHGRTEIIERLGEEHVRTGRPIFYTSADSVIQIAAHEEHFGLDRLYDLCRTVRGLVDPLNIGRVIARPFVGETAATFERTANRRDYAVPPPEPTLLDRLISRGGKVTAIGKIGSVEALDFLCDRLREGEQPFVKLASTAISELPNADLLPYLRRQIEFVPAEHRAVLEDTAQRLEHRLR